MWCIGALTEEYRCRMYSLLELYARPLSRSEPVICIDEKSLQLIGDSRVGLPMAPRSPAKQDYEYVRNGTTNLFVAVEPKAGKRVVSVTEHRGKTDFVAFIGELLTGAYAKARRIHLVLDNLNTHFAKSFIEAFGAEQAALVLARLAFHYTPKHASWLNQVELWFGKIERDVIARGVFTSVSDLKRKLVRYIRHYNKSPRTVKWKYANPSRHISPKSVVTGH